MAFCITQKVLFKHCDPAGIVFYPRYFEMINDLVEVFFSDALKYPFETIHKTNGVPTVEISIKFPAASRHGDILDICLEPQKIGRTSCNINITAQCDNHIRFLSSLTLVHVNDEGRPSCWPEFVFEQITKFINERENQTMDL